MDASLPAPRPPHDPRPRPLPLSQRKREARRAARARIVARTTVALSPEQRARDPLAKPDTSKRRRVLRGIRATIGSLLVHAAMVLLGFLTGGLETGKREVVEQKIKIEMREPPPPPPLPPEPAQVEAEKPRPAPKPEVKKAPPPPTPEPPAETPPTPTRIIGLSLESTSEGGGGPAFAVGNTRQGKTDERAADPSTVPTEPPSGEPAPGTNQTASRLPSAGVVYTKPRRVKQGNLIYPETLKAQGIEERVKVSLSLDATGKVVNVRILTPSPYPEFNAAAKAAALDEVFEPANRDGTPIPYSFSFTYTFDLNEQ